MNNTNWLVLSFVWLNITFEQSEKISLSGSVYLKMGPIGEIIFPLTHTVGKIVKDQHTNKDSGMQRQVSILAKNI